MQSAHEVFHVCSLLQPGHWLGPVIGLGHWASLDRARGAGPSQKKKQKYKTTETGMDLGLRPIQPNLF